MPGAAGPAIVPPGTSPQNPATGPGTNSGNVDKAHWVTVGATIDNTAGQAPTFSDNGGFSFAELLQAGTNRGLHPTLTEVLKAPGGKYGMPMGTAIHIRMPNGNQIYKIIKNDVGSGQAGDPHYKIDLHPKIAAALGWQPNQDVEVAYGLTFQKGTGGQVVDAVSGAIKSLGQALSFIFSLQFLYVIGGFVLLLLALFMVYRSVGK